MNPPAVIDLAAALSASSPELEAIAAMIAGAENNSLLTSGVIGPVNGLADMTSGASNHLVGAADELAGFKLPNMPTGIGGVTGALTTPGQTNPLTGAATATTNQTGDTAASIGIAPALPVTSPNSKPTKGAAPTPIGAAPTPTTNNTTAAAPKGGSPIGSPPVVPAAALAPVAVPQAKGATATPITGTTNLNPAAQSAMGIAPSPAHGPAAELPKGATGTPIGSMPGSIATSMSPYAGDFAGINELIIERNQARFDSLLAQGFNEADALSFIIAKGSPTDSTFGSASNIAAMTVAELAYLTSTWEEGGRSGNDPILDAMIRELDKRTEQAGAGQHFSNANLDALVVAEVMGVEFGAAETAVAINQQQTLLASITEQVEALDGMHPTHQTYVLEDINDSIGELVAPELVPLVAAALHNGADIDVAILLATSAHGINADIKPSEVHLLQTEINGFVADGEDLDSAFQAVLFGKSTGHSAAEVLEIAGDDGIDLATAANMVVQADFIGLDVGAHQALQGLQDETIFAEIDNATGGNTDGVVSIGDLEHVVNAPLGTFSPEVVAAAAAALANPELLTKLDDAADNNDLLDDDSFGSTEYDDQKFSIEDIQAFTTKAQLNGILGGHGDAIDIADDAGGVADGYFSKSDYQAYLDQADELGLSDGEVAALEMIVDQEMFDQTFFEEHRDEIALAAAVVGAVVVVAATGGAASGLVLVGIGALAGGTAAAGTTLLINATSDNFELTDGVAGNTFNGAMVGASVGGVGAIVTNAPTILAGSTGGQVLAGLGLASEGAAIVGGGGADLLLSTAGVSDGTIADITGTANVVSLATGAPDLAIGVVTLGAKGVAKLGGLADNASTAANAVDGAAGAANQIDNAATTAAAADLDGLVVTPSAAGAIPEITIPSAAGVVPPVTPGSLTPAGTPKTPTPVDPVSATIDAAHNVPGATVGATQVNAATGVTITKLKLPNGANAVVVATPSGPQLVSAGSGPAVLGDGTTVIVSSNGATQVRPPGGQLAPHGDVVAESLDSAPNLTPSNQKGMEAHAHAKGEITASGVNQADIAEEAHITVHLDGQDVNIHPDFLVKNPDGTFTYYESKYSPNAPFTPNQQTVIAANDATSGPLHATVTGNVDEMAGPLGIDQEIEISDIVVMVMNP